jgi:hypothetical protein
MLKKLISITLLLQSAGFGSLFGQTTAQAREDANAQRDNFLQMNRQIFARHEDPGSGNVQAPDRVKLIEARLRAAIQRSIAHSLRGPNPIAGEVTDAIREIQGAMTFGRNDMTNTPFADFSRLSAGQTLAVAYMILEGGEGVPDSQPFIEFYLNEGGTWRLKATMDSDFKSSTLFLSRINAGLAGENWYLAWGKRIGDPSSYVNVRIYGFDGNTVRTVWKRDGLAGGQISHSSDSVTLDYRKGWPPSEEIHEVLHVTPDGLQ